VFGLFDFDCAFNMVFVFVVALNIKQKSVYSSNGDDSTRGKRVQSPTVSSSCEARVFAKVCVAHLVYIQTLSLFL